MTLLMHVSPIALAALAAGAPLAPPAARPAAPHEMTIVARDFTFDAPDSIASGAITIHLENRGPNLHHLAIVRLDSGHTVDQFQAAIAHAGFGEAPWPAWVTYFGGPNAVTPGGKATATVNLDPGHYLITCLVHSPDSASHTMVSHVVFGMIHPLTVTGPIWPVYLTPPAQPSRLPDADVTVTLLDYAFLFSHPLVAGHHVIRVHNVATQPHELFIGRLTPGKSAADLPTWILHPAGPPPLTPIGGITPISRGQDANIIVDLPPGEYGLYCYYPDAHDGKPHLAHGMMRQITVAATGYAEHVRQNTER